MFRILFVVDFGCIGLVAKRSGLSIRFSNHGLRLDCQS